ncbi:hypothetical protein ABZ864_47735 [Streptomyces sp. NPDC047082]|uniref:hypothetical protein n=1 Tax=Streptomyces sp. NPDC047082 TaxID=3155259 RepID=UPI003408A15C
MSSPVSLPMWAPLTSAAAGCALFAAVEPGARCLLAVMAAVLGLAAITAYGSRRGAAGRPAAAVVWTAAAGVGGVLTWGMGKEYYPYGYVVAGFLLLVGLGMLPGHLRRSAR